MAKCKSCGATLKSSPFGTVEPLCKNCKKQIIAAEQEKEAREQEKFASIILTTAPSIEGYRVTDTIDIITAECTFGMNIFRDFFAGARDFFGGRSKATQKVLRDARNICLKELREEAVFIGANAVIAVDLDYSEFSGGRKSMLFLVASGTAVCVEPVTSEPVGVSEVKSHE